MAVYKVPSLETRLAVVKWRWELFSKHWDRYAHSKDTFTKRQYLLAKIHTLVDTDRLMMPDGPGAIKRVVDKKPE